MPKLKLIPDLLFEKITVTFVFQNTKLTDCGSSSVGRALASQAKGRGFESRLPLQIINLKDVYF
jgi:hypothetical protein